MTSRTVLYIDDDQVLLRLIGSFLEALGYRVLTAPDGRQGLEIFREAGPDVIFVDLLMPDVDGFDVLETVSREAPDTPILVISGEGAMPDVIRALRLGAWNYLTKPIEDYLLIKHSLEQALEKAELKRENRAYQQELEKKIRQKSDALVKNEKKLSAIIDAFDGFIYTCDNDFRITYVNPLMGRALGREAMGEVCHEAIYGLAEPCPWCVDHFYRGQVVKQEFRNPVDRRWYAGSQSPLFDAGGELQERQVILHDITERKQEIEELQEQEEYLRRENMRLRASMSANRYRFADIIGKSEAMQEVYETIINAAATDANVIIYGESGTGKELVAKAIHETSDRKDGQLVYVNCGAIPENLIESEFFGHKKGAFTGAAADKHGFLDLADRGTLFLDEIGELPLNVQVKLLRVLEGSGYTPVGGVELKKTDVRIIAATNRDLKELVKQGGMRHDFLYRIHIIPIQLPPLRERRDDIWLLVDHFLESYEPEKVPPLTPAIRRAIQNYDWPGNVRELQNTIHRFVALKKLDLMGLELSPGQDLLGAGEVEPGQKPLARLLEDFEKRLLLRALENHKWHQGRTADSLRIDRRTLYRKMKQFNIEKHPSR